MEKDLKPKSFVAKVFGVSVRRIEQLTAEGIIISEGRPAKYDFIPTVQAYIEYLSNKAYAREKKKTVAELEQEKLEAEGRYKKAKADMAELELKELEGELHRASDVEAITTDHVMYLRSMLMALPGKLAVDMASIQTAPEAAERMKQEVYAILKQLSGYRYNPSEYKKRVRERQGWKDARGEDDDG